MLYRYSAALLPLAVGACAQAVTLPEVGAIAPAFSAAPIAAPVASVDLAYTPRDVTDPANWRELNDAQGPVAEGSE